MYGLMNSVAKGYIKKLNEQDDKHWSKQLIKDRGFSDETLINFQIGYAPDEWKYVTNVVTEHGKTAIAKATGIITVKDGKSFDFFKKPFNVSYP